MSDTIEVPVTVFHQFGMPREAVQRWADWYGSGLGYLGFVAYAMARCSATERWGLAPAHGDGIRFGDPRYTWTFGPFIPADAEENHDL